MGIRNAELAFKEYLASQKLKYTSERREIFKEIMSSDAYFDADDLINRMKTHEKRVSRATVYRTLDLLVRLGILHRLSLGHKTSLYENNLNWKQTGHLVCINCEAVREFKVARTIDEQIWETCGALNFRPQNRSVQVYGLCEACESQSLDGLVQAGIAETENNNTN